MNKDILPVLDEISAILKKHDMVGLFVVGNPTHCDWRMDIEASWSCAKTEADETGRVALRVRSKLADFPSKEAQHKCMEATVGTFVTLSDVNRKLGLTLDEILVMLSKHVDFRGGSRTEE